MLSCLLSKLTSLINQGEFIPSAWVNRSCISSDAVIWATDVLGEFEINNKEPITKIGSGLHPKSHAIVSSILFYFFFRFCKQCSFLSLFSPILRLCGLKKIGGPKVLAKIKDLSVKDQGSVYSNLIDDIAIERTIKRAMIIRRLLLSGNQAETSNERDKNTIINQYIKNVLY
jgi:hypothetical protein